MGHRLLQGARELIEKHFTKDNGYKSNALVVYGDTDSLFIDFLTDDVKEAF